MAKPMICGRCHVEIGDGEEILMGSGDVSTGEPMHDDRNRCDLYLKSQSEGVRTVIGSGSNQSDPSILGEARSKEGGHLMVVVDGVITKGQGVTVIQKEGEPTPDELAEIHIVFFNPVGQEMTFVEIQDAKGNIVEIGGWRHMGEDCHHLVFTAGHDESGTLTKREAALVRAARSAHNVILELLTEGHPLLKAALDGYREWIGDPEGPPTIEGPE